MPFPDATLHLNLCRKLQCQLQRVESQHRDTTLPVPINIKSRTPLPIDLRSLIEQLDEYIEWAESNKGTVEAAFVMTPKAGRRDGAGAARLRKGDGECYSP
jgi:hypothetical protein